MRKRRVEAKPSESVPLHQLCDRCLTFSRESRSLDGLSKNEAYIPPGTNFEKFKLWTVEQLAGEASPCHLCKLIAACHNPKGVHSQTEVGLSLGHALNTNYVFGFVDQYGYRIDNNLTFQTYKWRATERNDHARPLALDWTQVPQDPRQNISALKGWLNSCLNWHPQCMTPINESKNNLIRPKRILNIANGQIRLRCDIDDRCYDREFSNFRYATLSHMWGSNPTHQLRLVQDRLEEFQKVIPETEMSHSYVEAIRIARALGLRYLWIDSLCIIQDSKPDWTQEASKMTAIYGHAMCNLAYLFPPENPPPKLREDPRCYAPCILRRASRQSDGIYVSRSQSRLGGVFHWLEQRDWPLLHRAWVMQERLLCRRTIYLGHQNLIWECFQTFSDELIGDYGSLQWPDQEFYNGLAKPDIMREAPHLSISGQDIPSEYHEDWQRLNSFLDMWECLCSNYAAMLLTQESDRVMAFAGIAEAMQNVHALTYVAGLWRDYLQPGLLWYKQENQDLRKLSTDEVPSWSWFSLQPVALGTDSYSTQDKWLFWCSPQVQFCNWARVVAVSVPDGLRKYHDLRGSRIDLSTRTVYATLTRSKADDRKLLVRFAFQPELDVKYWPDDTGQSFNQQKVKVAVVCTNAKPSSINWLCIGLVLVADREADGEILTWKRLGLWQTGYHSSAAMREQFEAFLVEETLSLT